ncbi:MAG: protein-tyrosine-phosphatase, partial [Ignavibacteriae bacterium]|nr:protein-tyrosine-phosphatase [Ignavibacteriota bacterium]
MIKQNLKYKISELEKRFHEIPTERKKLLNQFAQYISGKLKSDEEINLIFICTHNSRRSHMSQIWAQTSAEYFN